MGLVGAARPFGLVGWDMLSDGVAVAVTWIRIEMCKAAGAVSRTRIRLL